MPTLQDASASIHTSLNIQTYKNKNPDAADKKLDAQLMNTGHSKKYTFGAVNSVIQRASLLVSGSVEAKRYATRNRTNGRLFYGQRGTLTHFSLQQVMCELESGAGCVLLPYGVAVVANSILASVGQGDHMSMTNTVYESGQDFCSKILNKLGIATPQFDLLIDTDIIKYLQPGTKAVFLESSGSIIMKIHDIPAIVVAMRSVVLDAVIMVDNTWTASVLSKVLDFDIDVPIQAVIKYLVGRSDTMTGTTMCSVYCWEQLRENTYLMGQVADTDTTYITSRGLRTSGMRLRQHRKSSLKVAEQSAEHPQVVRVNHPALPGSEDHRFWRRDFVGGSGLFSFVLKKEFNDEELVSYLDNLDSFNIAYSWSGYGSLILVNQPEHIAVIHLQGKIDFNGALIHLHIGLEDVDDLTVDLGADFA